MTTATKTLLDQMTELQQGPADELVYWLGERCDQHTLVKLSARESWQLATDSDVHNRAKSTTDFHRGYVRGYAMRPAVAMVTGAGVDITSNRYYGGTFYLTFLVRGYPQPQKVYLNDIGLLEEIELEDL